MPLEVFEPFAHPGRVVETTQFRSSWLASSLRAVRNRGRIDEYKRGLEPRHQATILESVAGVWLPIDVAIAHYRAIDALRFGAQEAYQMGMEAQSLGHSTTNILIKKASQTAGVTPWTIFGQLRRLWERTWVGGDFAVFRPGPKDAVLEVVGWSIAPSTYVHHAMRGVIFRIVSPFCERMFIREIPIRSATSLSYRLSWA